MKKRKNKHGKTLILLLIACVTVNLFGSTISDMAVHPSVQFAFYIISLASVLVLILLIMINGTLFFDDVKNR